LPLPKEITMKRPISLFLVAILSLVSWEYAIANDEYDEYFYWLDACSNRVPSVVLWEKDYETANFDEIRILVSLTANPETDSAFRSDSQVLVQVGFVADDAVAFFTEDRVAPKYPSHIISARTSKIYSNRTRVCVTGYNLPECRIKCRLFVKRVRGEAAGGTP
jgi:hypothetical protein